MNYTQDRAWSDRWIPEIRRIVGPQLLTPSSFQIDTEQAADLVILKARDMTVACRIRRAGYAARYPNQFTIRSARDSGSTTELEKITNGFGDWLFYGHESGERISPWLLVDLAAWRAHMIRRDAGIKRGNQANGDGTHFAWFDVDTFPKNPNILVSRSDPDDPPF